MTTKLVWFREDLRTMDNPALYYASKSSYVAGIYVISPTLFKKHDVSDNKIIFILDGLEKLQKQLASKNISLKVIVVDNTEDIKKELYSYAVSIAADNLYFNNQYEVNEKKRDNAVKEYFEERGLTVKSFHDQCLFEPGTVLTQNQDYYQIYTPFKNACWKKFNEGALPVPLPEPRKQEKHIGESNAIPRQFAEFNFVNARAKFSAGEQAAKKQLEGFIIDKIIDYKKQRDFPAIDGTSKLSPYFATGMISPQQCLATIIQSNKHSFLELPEGPLTWVNEILWREFYRHILVGFPRVSKHRAFKLATEKITWNDNQDFLQKWQEGNTGVPIVDAAMRQLNQTGWMHNRLRMIVAMFFSKNLFLNWRLGEKYFMKNLIDGDLASNNGGWQWSASTGVDAAPYFRIFNPYLQSQRFDPEGAFIKQYIPELKNADKKSVHNPAVAGFKSNYPKPMVDMQLSKEKAIKVFQSLPSAN